MLEIERPNMTRYSERLVSHHEILEAKLLKRNDQIFTGAKGTSTVIDRRFDDFPECHLFSQSEIFSLWFQTMLENLLKIGTQLVFQQSVQWSIIVVGEKEGLVDSHSDLSVS